jgi:hypothetical protein
LNSAVRTFPKWMYPVGDGANLTRIIFSPDFHSFYRAKLEQEHKPGSQLSQG